MGIGHDGTFAWSSRAALVQMAFCGMNLIGFAVWMFTNILPVMQNAPDASFWINPILYTISQPIGAVVAIVGAYLLLKRRNIGLYVSIASVPILLINDRWIIFIGVIFSLIYYLLLAGGQAAQSELYLICYVWVGIYNACIATIAILLAICWKVERHRLNDDARKFVVTARVLLADIFSRCKQ